MLIMQVQFNRKGKGPEELQNYKEWREGHFNSSSFSRQRILFEPALCSVREATTAFKGQLLLAMKRLVLLPHLFLQKTFACALG